MNVYDQLAYARTILTQVQGLSAGRLHPVLSEINALVGAAMVQLAVPPTPDAPGKDEPPQMVEEGGN